MDDSSGRVFDHVVIIIFENEYRSFVKQNPFIRELAAQGTELESSFGVMHPSNTNYVASIAGTICNITADPLFNTLIPGAPSATVTSLLPQRTVADLLCENKLSWKAYMEGYQPVEFPPQLNMVMNSADPPAVDPVASLKHTILDHIPYMNMHNPFVRFSNIAEREEQWRRIRPLYDFFTDALNDTLPEYSWITPNLWGDGHYLWGSYDEPPERAPVLVDQQARWLETFFRVLAFPGPHSRLPERTLVVVTYDEADFENDYIQAQHDTSDYDGPNQVYTVLLGDMAQPGRVESEGCNHYTLLRTIEKNFDLGDLGTNDAAANWFQFLWGRAFRWYEPVETPIEASGSVSAAAIGDTLHVVFGTGDGNVGWSTLRGGQWTKQQNVPALSGVTSAELAVCNNALTLVCQSGGALIASTCNGGIWSQPETIVAAAPAAFALASFANQQKLMLAWYGSDTAIQSQVFAGGAWSAPVAVGQQSDGDLTIAVLGPSLFLIAKEAGSDAMNVVSYNTGDWNVVTGTKNGSSDATSDAWSPSAFPVAHFGRGPRRRGEEPQPRLRTYCGAAPFVTATLDGVVHLATAGVNTSDVVTETFSLSGLLTPANKVDYASTASGTSNGFGTLAEGGWTQQMAIDGVTTTAGGALAMAQYDSGLVLLSQPKFGSRLRISVGRYDVDHDKDAPA
jgi:hypothetical protein